MASISQTNAARLVSLGPIEVTALVRLKARAANPVEIAKVEAQRLGVSGLVESK